MFNDEGKIAYGIGLDNTQLLADAKKVNQVFAGIGNKAEAEGARIDNTFKKIGTGIAAYFGTQQLIGFTKDIARVRGEFQQLEVSFQTMLRNKVAADKLLNEVVTAAATTPYELRDVGQGAKQLLAFQVPAEEVVDTLKQIGDLAAGVDAPINDLIKSYGKVKAKGKLQAEEMNLFLERGIPLITELAKKYDTTEQAIYKMSEQGQIGFKDLQEVINNLTEDGGMFFNMMEAQSKTITGQISNLSDAWAQMLNEIGKSNEGTINDSITAARYLIEHYEEVWKILKVLIATYGTYKAAVIAAAAAQKASIAAGNIQAWFQLARGIRTAKDAQILFNLATKANPIGLVVSAITAAVTAFILFNRKTNEATEASARLAASISNETTELRGFVKDIKNAKEGTEARTKAIESFNTKYGSYIDNLLNEKSTVEDIATAYNQAKDALVDMQVEKARTTFLGGSIENVTKATERFYINASKIGEKLTTNEQRLKFQKYMDDLVEEIKSGEGYYDLNKIEDAFRAAQSKGDYATVQDFIDAFRAGEEEYGKSFSLVGGKVFNLDESGKSLESYSKILTQSTKDFDEFSKTYYDKANNKPVEIISFENPKEKIEEIEFEIEALTNYLDDLRSGKSVSLNLEADISDTEKEIKKLKDQLKTYTGESEKDAQKSVKNAQDVSDQELAILRSVEQDRIDLMVDGYEKEKAQAELNHQRRLDAIRADKKDYENLVKLSGGTANLTNYNEAEKNSALLKAKEIEDIEKRHADAVTQIRSDLFATNSTYIQREEASINAKYDRLAKKAKDDAKLQSEIQKARQQELDELSINEELRQLNVKQDIANQEVQFAEDAEIKKLEIAIEFARKRIELLKKSSAEGVGQEIELLQGFIDLSEEQKALIVNQKHLNDLARYAYLMDQLGQALSQIDNPFGDIGASLAGIASQADNVLVSFDKQAETSDKVSAGINGLITLIDIVASSAKQRKEAEEAYYRSVINYQKEYNHLLNEQILQQDAVYNNVFTTDYINQIQSGLEARTDALQKYYESVAKLEEGRAKTGQRDAVDWNNVGAGAGAGAAVGAAVGSIVPIIGTAVGAVVGGVVGGLVGLFGGKKKQDEFTELLKEYPELIDQSKQGVEQFNEELATSIVNQGLVDDKTKDLINDTKQWVEDIKAANEQIKSVISDLAGSLGNSLRNSLVESFKAGEDAAVAMGETVSSVLEDILAQLIFDQIYSQAFKNLEDEMAASFDVGGDQQWMDDFGRFFEQANKLDDQWNQALETAKKQGENFGFNLFDINGQNREATQKGFAAITQDSADELNGRFTVIQGHTFQITESMKILAQNVAVMITYLASIDHNTENLDPIKNDISEMKGSIRSLKAGIDDINTKGIKLRS